MGRLTCGHMREQPLKVKAARHRFMGTTKMCFPQFSLRMWHSDLYRWLSDPQTKLPSISSQLASQWAVRTQFFSETGTTRSPQVFCFISHKFRYAFPSDPQTGLSGSSSGSQSALQSYLAGLSFVHGPMWASWTPRLIEKNKKWRFRKLLEIS